MVDVEIDGQKISVEAGTTVIEAAEMLGIYIPRYCYHKKLSIVANCRMCLVEVEKSGKPLPACATQVMPDMKVFTASQKALDAQRSVMEFLLINHPLDCPICDQGGECELQDLATGYGSAYSNYNEPKRAVFSDDLGPLIDTEMTRCIHCTRCIRFGEEVAGLQELGATGRGEDMQVGTYIKHFMRSELSGNIIDLCPVGALTSKPYRYSGRGWEMVEHPTIAPHDCVGSNLFVHSRVHDNVEAREVMRVVPRENEAINEIWISDRDRFSYEALTHADRALKPRMKKDGQWVEVEWKRALLEIADRTKAIVDNQGADQVAALASPNSTLEEFYVLQKLLRSLGSDNIDHRVRQQDFTDQHTVPEMPTLGCSIEAIENCDAILLVGSDVRSEAPLIGSRINKAYQEEASVMAINAMDYTFTFGVSDKLIATNILLPLMRVAKALESASDDPVANAMVKKLKAADNGMIFIGVDAINHPNSAQIKALVRFIGKETNCRISTITEGANTCGAWLAGAVPHRGPANKVLEHPGRDARSLCTDKPARAYYLFNVEPEFDSAFPAAALAALKEAGLVVCFTAFASKAMEAYADFILPIAPFTETSGTFVNAAGTWQTAKAVTVPQGDAKPAWKVFRAMANFLELEGFAFKTWQQVRDELKQKTEHMPAFKAPDIKITPAAPIEGDLIRIAPVPMYRVDNLVRRAHALQACVAHDKACIAVNANVAKKLGLEAGQRVTATQNESRVTLPLHIDDRLDDKAVLIPSGLKETAGFGQAMAAVTLQREAS